MSTISIVVPVYNSEQYLKNCINSILDQQFTDFELLCIDDGSKDGSGKILDEYALKDSRIKVYHNQNRGVSYTRNFGIEKASSPYIVFVDSDDSVNNQYLHQLYSGIDDECQLAVCGMEVTDAIPFHSEQNTQSKFDIISFSEKDDRKLGFCITNRYFDCACAKIFSSDIIKKNNIRFDENISFGEDNIFVLDYLRFVEKFCLIDNPLYYYNRHSNSLSTSVKSDFDRFTKGLGLTEELFFSKNIFGTEVQKAIDHRRVLVAEYSLYPLFHSDISDKYQSVKNILYNSKLAGSLTRLKKKNMLTRFQKIMCFRSPFLLKIYYDKTEGKLSLKHIIKKLLHP